MTLGIVKRFDLVGKPEWIEKETSASRVVSYSFYLALLVDGEWSATYTGRFILPEKEPPLVHFTERLVGPTAGLDASERRKINVPT